MHSRDYWNENLDTDNLSRSRGAEPDLEESIAFARTPEFEWLRRRIGDVRGRRVVDLGGGLGMHALIWAREGAEVYVTDAATKRMHAMLRLAERAGVSDRVRCVVAEGERLPFASESVDVVFTKSVLIHTKLDEAASEIRRVLKSGGRGAFIEPLARNPIIRAYRGLLAPRIWKSITRYFDRDAIDTLRRPFGRLRWKPFYLFSAGSFFWQYGYKRLSWFERSLSFWTRVDRALLRAFPELEHWCWFAAMEVRKGEESADSDGVHVLKE